MASTNTINVRYIVKSVDEAIAFYSECLDFTVDMHPAPGFAALSRDNLRLFLNEPGAGGAGQTTPDGSVPVPGGWNRFQIMTDDLDSEVKRLKAEGARFKSDIINGVGGRQILLQDPSGNLIELFEAGQR